ncbi:MAG TPA: hypothetical protein VFK76_09725 [Gaiellaceae bacterium]|nr:hypothetical protein [Gaiellaceae bacterium]
MTARRGGWRRRGSRSRFRYEDARGTPIAGDAELERISGLAIPPAWRDVWISPSSGAKLQATGLDSAGRRQYLYHPEYRAAREAEKFERLVRFGEGLPRLRESMIAHLRLGPYEREWACAVAVAFVNRAWFRVGSERHARSTRTYGVTTLHKRHATVRGSKVSFRRDQGPNPRADDDRRPCPLGCGTGAPRLRAGSVSFGTKATARRPC